jgi:hypothetical protein
MTDCPRHKHCAYTGTEPGLCPICHASHVKCGGSHGQTPADGWSRGVATGKHSTLRAGQYQNPLEAAKRLSPVLTAPADLSEAAA